MRSPLLYNAFLVLSLSALGSAAPAASTRLHPDLVPRKINININITPEQIAAIAPKSTSCANPPAPGECATAAQAAPHIARSFETYQVTSAAEQAAVIALMAFESGEFAYNRNHFPGVPGQGTRNMQSPAFNAKYAAALPELAEPLAQAAGDPARVLDLLLANEEYDFGSGAWFLATQCARDVRAELQAGSEAGWQRYITGCVGTEANAERRAYWARAVQVLGV
ncbi:uncharacterized protein ACLA_095860 [Aspergillus clavatus NRRL 1]|uniref:Transglycosylase SLT domain-containing protein n=1 Tax=Aspergillus clavatus (strain ATCC 1007 / CBS 513.65 / DSM 816 / NCTC 3887 / NRRL 1 / QM 1276 / 107) TaxID=344612 RepID=A1CM66_ASPCL|nr:uncharacterized protein ACLA_095860 [Aspergillus clavatus NRRL 1]EAW08653.1 conserved hypothetical protein [Aspergillus clavatus NRRL 1]